MASIRLYFFQRAKVLRKTINALRKNHQLPLQNHPRHFWYTFNCR